MRFNKNQWIVFTAAAVIFGLIAAFSAVYIIKGYTNTAKVVIAVREIPAYKKITADDLKVVEMPKISIPTDAAVDISEITGKYLMWPVIAGDMIRKSKIADFKIDSILSAKLTHLKDPKLRAFALPYTKETGVGGEIEPGDRVDIIASVKIDSGSGLTGVGKIIAQDVLVLETQKPQESGTGILIVALNPEQIEDIAFALTSGNLRFALNGYDTDPDAAKTGGVTGNEWLEKYGFRNTETKRIDGTGAEY